MSPSLKGNAQKPRAMVEDNLEAALDLERELDKWSLDTRFPLMPGQRHVEAPNCRPLGMQYGEDAEPVGQQFSSRLVALLAFHADSAARVASLGRCLRSAEAQKRRPDRFLVGTSAVDPAVARLLPDVVQSSPSVDEYVAAHDGQPVAQFEHYRRMRDVVRHREDRLEDVWVFISGGDDSWHPCRCADFAVAVDEVRRRVQRDVYVVGSCDPGFQLTDLCVRFSTFSAFFEEHSSRVLRHPLADIRFCSFVRHCGEIPRKLDGQQALVKEQVGVAAQAPCPDDECLLANLEELCGEDLDCCFSEQQRDQILPLCAALRQLLDHDLFRLPRSRFTALESEVLHMAASASDSFPARRLEAHGIKRATVAKWLRAVAFCRCKLFRVELFKFDFCAGCGRESTFQCGHCRAESYCSEDCQRAAWNEGHGLRCDAASQPHLPTDLRSPHSEPDDFQPVD
ncbi:unnamed protein product [Polarella glacialis]|uniref:MYND-type domain-containing protein n=1 Tax=Polarella glacialis TaxID=89957 RepID=A0A813IXJ8_POLGL|nr:unnamed protein product [Polarella glacialis]